MKARIGSGVQQVHYVHCTACKWKGTRINRDGDFGACKCGGVVERSRSREEIRLEKLWRETHQGTNA